MTTTFGVSYRNKKFVKATALLFNVLLSSAHTAVNRGSRLGDISVSMSHYLTHRLWCLHPNTSLTDKRISCCVSWWLVSWGDTLMWHGVQSIKSKVNIMSYNSKRATVLLTALRKLHNLAIFFPQKISEWLFDCLQFNCYKIRPSVYMISIVQNWL